MTQKRSILVLHGYAQNASIFSKRLGALRRECGNSVELVFVDAPHILQPADIPGSAAQFGAAEASSTVTDPTLTPRAWWKANPDKSVAYGLRESIDFIRDLLKGRQFDGVLGFSQGAAFAAIITSLLERSHVYAPFLIDGKPPHPPFQLCVAVSGFRLQDPFCHRLYDDHFSTPTLHIIGRNDIIVHEERSRALIAVSSNARVEEHDGGHFLPSKRVWLKFLHGYLMDPSADLLPPSLTGPSDPGALTESNNGSTVMKL